MENYPRSAICIMIADKLKEHEKDSEESIAETDENGDASEDEFHSVGSQAPTIGSVQDNE